jgi:hypothetical protein
LQIAIMLSASQLPSRVSMCYRCPLDKNDYLQPSSSTLTHANAGFPSSEAAWNRKKT